MRFPLFCFHPWGSVKILKDSRKFLGLFHIYFLSLFFSCSVALISSNETDDNRSYNLPQCPEGYIVQVRTDVPSEEEQLGGFCVAQIESEEDDPQYVGRFCVADPCKQSNCIRKCCPEGMAIIGRTCQSFAEEFAPVVRRKNGAVENITDITILAGVGAPICKEGINLLMPSNNSYDEFLVLPSGSIHIPSYSQDLGVEYCTDILLGDNTKVVRIHCKIDLVRIDANR